MVHLTKLTNEVARVEPSEHLLRLMDPRSIIEKSLGIAYGEGLITERQRGIALGALEGAELAVHSFSGLRREIDSGHVEPI